MERSPRSVGPSGLPLPFCSMRVGVGRGTGCKAVPRVAAIPSGGPTVCGLLGGKTGSVLALCL